MELTAKNLKIIEIFIQHCCVELKINLKNVKVNLLINKRISKVSAGGFNPETKEIFCSIKNRAVADCLRTIAHELTHMKQKIVDNIENFPENDEELQKFEDEANIMAGKLVRFWGRSHPEIYEDLN